MVTSTGKTLQTGKKPPKVVIKKTTKPTKQSAPTTIDGPLVGREQEYKEIEQVIMNSVQSGLGCCLCTDYYCVILA